MAGGRSSDDVQHSLGVPVKLLWLLLVFRHILRSSAFNAFPWTRTPLKFHTTLAFVRKIDSTVDGASRPAAGTSAQWFPQDLTQDSPGFPPIPDDDYIKLYQRQPIEMWPVELFVIPYRRIRVPVDTSRTSSSNSIERRRTTTQILVRASSNGTAKWGLGTGVPVTRWAPISRGVQGDTPPAGYEWSTDPPITIDASIFPTFDAAQSSCSSWEYQKIHLKEDALFSLEHANDPALNAYAHQVHGMLRDELMRSQTSASPWESIVQKVLRHVLDQPNCVTAIQGSFRMSGLFAMNNQRPLPTAVRVYTMFPHMPDPLPPPTTPADQLQQEIANRPTGQHDKYGRIYTHISTANVSNTIHGIYMVVDMGTCDDNDTAPPAYDLLGTDPVPKEWKSLAELGIVVDDASSALLKDDPKPLFISAHIVRQLVREGAIPTR